MPNGSIPTPGEPDAADDHPEASDHRLRYQELFEVAPDSHMVTARQGVILAANYAAAELLDCSKEFLIGKPLGLFVSNGYRPRFYQQLGRLTAAPGVAFESRVGRGGDPRDVLILPVGIDRDGGCRWVLKDISLVKQAEKDRDELL